jgi:hypothetical protein
MSVTGKNTTLVPVLPAGMKPADSSGPLWIQNLTRIGGDGGWATRPGAGLIARLDSGLTAGKLSNTQDLGISRVIGTHAFTSSFGHDMVAIFCRAQVWSTTLVESLVAQRATVYTLFIYNLTYDAYTEHTLHHHTSEDALANWQRHGHYDTDPSVDRQHWYDAGAGAVIGNRLPVDDEVAWFVEANNQLIFGSSRSGAWVYSPGVPSPNRTQVNSAFARDWKEPFSEDGSVMPLRAREGVFGEGYAYLTPEEFGRPTAACAFGERVVYAVGNTLLYSDPGEPSAIAALNVDLFGDDITAVAARYGILYVFTANKTYYVNPANGFLISGGNIIELSKFVGCLSAACVAQAGNAIVFAHSSGIYSAAGSTGLTELSGDILPLFDGEGLENLWTRLTSSAITTPGTTLPQTYIQWTPQSVIGARLASDDMGRLYFNLPKAAISLVFEQGGWHVWSFETIANDASQVASTRNIPNPAITCLRDRVLVVGDVITQAQVDGTVFGGVFPEWSCPNRSISLHEIGRGGALDRSSGLYEDKRHIAGEYANNGINPQEELDVRDRGFYVIKPPIALPTGYNFSWAGVATVAGDDAFYLPIELVPTYDSIVPETQNLTAWYMEFEFDNTNFEPIFNANALNVYEQVFNLPTERLSARAAYALGVADNAFPKGVMVFDSGTGLPDPAGNIVKIYVNSAAGGAWTGHPKFNLNHRHRNPMLSLAFKRKSGSTGDIFAMGINYNAGTITDSSPATSDMACLVWRDTTSPMRTEWNETNDRLVQAVDWGVHAAEILLDGSQVKARGINFSIQSSGSAQVAEAASSWPNGLLNVAMAATRKDVSGQLVDLTAVQAPGLTSFEHDSLRSNVNNPRVQPTFNNGLAWGDDSAPGAGDFLVADSAASSLNTSGNMKGDRLSLSYWGHIKDKAERLKVLSAKAVLRAMGGSARRRGH